MHIPVNKVIKFSKKKNTHCTPSLTYQYLQVHFATHVLKSPGRACESQLKKTLILQPTRITSHSNTLIDNTFSNINAPDIMSGNLTSTISDHLPQYAIIPNVLD